MGRAPQDHGTPFRGAARPRQESQESSENLRKAQRILRARRKMSEAPPRCLKRGTKTQAQGKTHRPQPSRTHQSEAQVQTGDQEAGKTSDTETKPHAQDQGARQKTRQGPKTSRKAQGPAQGRPNFRSGASDFIGRQTRPREENVAAAQISVQELSPVKVFNAD